MTWKEAMKKCREGYAVRHAEMNTRWRIVFDGTQVVQQSDLGGQLDYKAIEHDRRREDWEVVP